MKNHVRYLGILISVCDDPDRLGSEFVVYDYDSNRESCTDCLRFLAFHNVRYHDVLASYDIVAANETATIAYDEWREKTFGRAYLTQQWPALLTGAFLMLLLVVGFQLLTMAVV